MTWGLVIALTSSLFALVQHPRVAEEFTRSLSMYSLAYAVYIGTLAVLPRLVPPRPAELFVLAVVPFLVLSGAHPHLSDDVFRYLWEGRAWALGKNPYEIPPIAAGVSDPFVPYVNHPELTAIYPPLFQVVLAAVTGVWYSMTAWKVVLVAAHTVACALLIKKTQVGPWLLAYAWNPLVLVESAGMGHLDLLPALCLLCACLSDRWRALAVGAAGALKYTPFVFSAAIRPRKMVLLALLPISGAFWVCEVLAPFESWTSLFSSLGLYAATWEFNSPLYYLGIWGGLSKGHLRLLFLVVIAGMGIAAAWRAPSPASWEPTVVAWTVLSAVIHPWYAVWIAVFLPFTKRLSSVYLCWALFLAYHVLPEYRSTGIWRESNLVIALEWLPYGLLLAMEVTRALSGRVAPVGGTPVVARGSSSVST